MKSTHLGARKSHCAIVQLILKLIALVLDAVVHDNRRDQSKPRIGAINAHDVEATQKKLERVANGLRLIFRVIVSSNHRASSLQPFLLSLIIAHGGLSAQDNFQNQDNQVLAVLPCDSASRDLLLD